MTNLFPIRIDASSSDNSIRLIDTLLIDPTCLPIPLSSFSEDAMQSYISQNTHEFVNTLLSDMEVYGTSRTSKHFAGRVDLWNVVSLREEMERQVKEQLEAAISLSVGNNAGITSTTSDATTKKDDTKKEETTKKEENPNLKRIKIRIRDNNILILDEFDYDTSTSPSPDGCPIAIANQLVQDLNLPESCGVAIATSIAEQICGSVEVEGDLSDMRDERADRDVPSAWVVDGKESGVLQSMVLGEGMMMGQSAASVGVVGAVDGALKR
uniref:Uncharacterized protein n=1 Tax=Ditylum brightwellii TaxID=49249 RepID=A0A7S1ZM05_9STRA